MPWMDFSLKQQHTEKKKKGDDDRVKNGIRPSLVGNGRGKLNF